jgi:hypothetical protein
MKRLEIITEDNLYRGILACGEFTPKYEGALMSFRGTLVMVVMMVMDYGSGVGSGW